MSGWSNQLSPSGIVTELFSGWPHALMPTKTAQQGMIPRHQACVMCPAHYECSQSRLANGFAASTRLVQAGSIGAIQRLRALWRRTRYARANINANIKG